MAWYGDLQQFKKGTFTCPSCSTKQSAEPISVNLDKLAASGGV